MSDARGVGVYCLLCHVNIEVVRLSALVHLKSLVSKLFVDVESSGEFVSCLLHQQLQVPAAKLQFCSAVLVL